MEWHQFLPSIGHLPARSNARIKKAFELGRTLHEGQTRKSGEPYFTHPMAVAAKLAEAGGDEDTIIAALLHDTVEDTPATLEDIERKFGPEVTMLIDGVTKLSSSEISGPNLNEQTETLRKIFRLMQADSRIMVIKLFDRLHNMETVQYLSEIKQKILAQETYDVYAKIADRLCMEDFRYELEELCLRILHPGTLERMLVLREKTTSQGQVLLQQMERLLRTQSAKVMSGVTMELEKKTWAKLEAQLDLEGTAVSGLSPVTLSFVCPNRDACYRVLGALHEPWRREILSFRDFINSPELNGYRGLHTTVILEDGTRVRCKIRTQEMQEYAHKGITLYCFDREKHHVLSELLPWTEQIESISEDTQHKSDDFWQGLQSDILGETVTIYGPDDKSVQVPKDGTVLDAAFYLFGEQTQRATSVFINGKSQSFATPIQHATSLSAQFDDGTQLTEEWLKWVHTSFATAKIRSALARRDETEQVMRGKEIFQELLSEKKKGFVEEFDDAKLQAGAKELGYNTIHEAYIAMAEGRLLPSELFGTAVEKRKPMRQDRSRVRVKFRISMDDLAGLDRLQKIRQRFYDQIVSTRIVHDTELRVERTFMLMELSSIEEEELFQNLTKAGTTHIRMETNRSFIWVLILSALLSVLWGFDPIFAKMLLLQGVTPSVFTMVRAATLIVLSGTVMLVQNPQQRFSRIPFSNPNLWLAGVSFFGVSLLTYLTLEQTSPILYNTVLRGNAVLLSVPLLFRAKFYRRLVFAIGSTILGYELLLRAFGLNWGMVLAFLVLLFFCIYTMASRRFQQQARVAARYPQFFFSSSMIAAMCSLGLLFVGDLSLPSLQLLGLLVGYCVLFIGFPYLAFYALMLRTGYSSVSPWINLSLLVTLVGQTFLLPLGGESMFVLPAILLVAGSTIASRSLARGGD